MEELVWRPDRQSWVDVDGTAWTRCRLKWLTEKDARSFVLRTSTVVAVEPGGEPDLRWLDAATRHGFWEDNVAGHLDDGSGAWVPANADGLTYRASMWTDGTKRRLILLSASC